MAMNGMVIAPDALLPERVFQEGALHDAVCVYIAAPPSDNAYEKSVREQPVVCEPLFHLLLLQSHHDERPGSSVTIGVPWRVENRDIQVPVIEGRFTSARITMT